MLPPSFVRGKGKTSVASRCNYSSSVFCELTQFSFNGRYKTGGFILIQRPTYFSGMNTWREKVKPKSSGLLITSLTHQAHWPLCNVLMFTGQQLTERISAAIVVGGNVRWVRLLPMEIQRLYSSCLFLRLSHSGSMNSWRRTVFPQCWCKLNMSIF